MAYEFTTLITIAVRHLSRAPATRLGPLAVVCGVSRHTLGRALRTETAMSYRQFQRQRLSARVDHLLQEMRPRSIKEIAFALGFATPQSFAKWLKRTTGCTPIVWRRKLVADAQKADVVGSRGFGAASPSTPTQTSTPTLGHEEL